MLSNSIFVQVKAKKDKTSTKDQLIIINTGQIVLMICNEPKWRVHLTNGMSYYLEETESKKLFQNLKGVPGKQKRKLTVG